MGLTTALMASEVSLFDMNSWWWAIVKGVYWVINAIEQAFYYLVGIAPVQTNADSTAPAEIQDILFLNITDPRVQKILIIFTVIAVGILIIFLAIGLIKACFQDNDQLAARGKMIEKAFSSFFIMLLLPLIFYIAVLSVGVLMQLVNGVMQNVLGSGRMGLAENIHQICLPKPNRELEWNSSYGALCDNGANENYQYFMAMITSGILIYVLIAICTMLVERLIEVVFFYLIAPFVLARAPLDDGGSFKLWKDNVIAKMLSAAGVIIMMYLYLILMSNVNVWFAPPEGAEAVKVIAMNAVRILFNIGGAFSVKKGALTVAQIVSQNAGVSEGMAQGQSMQMLSGGLNLGMGIAKGALRGAAMGMMMSRNGAGTMLGGATRGSGRAEVPVSTGDKMFSRASTTANSSGGNAAAAALSAGKADGLGLNASTMSSRASDGGAIVDNAAAGGSWTDGVLDSPYAPGDVGKMNRALRAGGGGIGSAFMYGGLIGGLGAIAGKVIGGAIGLAAKPFKFAAKKAGKAISKSAPVEAAKGKIGEMKAVWAAKREYKQNNAAFTNRKKLNDSIASELAKINSKAGKIDKKYGRKFGQGAVQSIQQARLGERMRNLDRKMKRLTSSGGAYKRNLNNFNRLANTNYSNDNNSNGGGKI